MGEGEEENTKKGWDAQKVCWKGSRDALNWYKALRFIVRLETRSSSISVQQCFILNGTLFLGSIILFHVVLIPVLDSIAEQLAWLDGGDKADWEYIQDLVQELSSLTFQMCWLIPMYIVSILLNAVFNVDIAKEVYTVEFGEPIRPVDSAVDLVRDSIYNYLLMGWVSLFCFGVYYIRVVGPLISLVWTSWAIAFYAFDLAWSLRGWDFQKRLVAFQKHWVYMLGFGLPSALVTFFLPEFLGYGVYALALPISIMLAVTSTPTQHSQPQVLPRSLRVFLFAEYVNLFALRLVGLARKKPK